VGAASWGDPEMLEACWPAEDFGSFHGRWDGKKSDDFCGLILTILFNFEKISNSDSAEALIDAGGQLDQDIRSISCLNIISFFGGAQDGRNLKRKSLKKLAFKRGTSQ